MRMLAVGTPPPTAQRRRRTERCMSALPSGQLGDDRSESTGDVSSEHEV